MESQELLHPENSETQNQEVNPEAAQAAQDNANESATPESAVEQQNAEIESVNAPEVAEKTAEVAEKDDEAVGQESQEPVSEETKQDIPVESEKQEETPEKPEETLEQVEAEYSPFGLGQCVEEMERLVSEPNFNLIKLRVGVLRAKVLEFLREKRHQMQAEYQAAKAEAEKKAAEEGAEAPQIPEFSYEPDELEKRFNAAFQTFKDNKAAFIENLEQQKAKNLELKNKIIDDLKSLLETETNLKVLNDKVKEFQEQWKAIGPVPQAESTNLWQNYHFYIEKFFDIVRMNREMRMLDYKKNLEMKMQLCEKAES
ncbi:MAG: DUF349 domain-containing protein, partial [Bacteroidales bacterium]|nr:DUF349 domain-containing protein [Bacteroidales bacterium]